MTRTAPLAASLPAEANSGMGNWLSVAAALGLQMVLAVGAGEGQGAGNAGAALPVLTNLQQVLELGNAVLQTSQHPVRVRGVVTAQVREKGVVYLQDRGFALSAQLPDGVDPYPPGTNLELDGLAVGSGQQPRLQAKNVRIVGTARLPAPKRGEGHKIAAGADPCRYLVVAGVVRDLLWENDELIYLLRHGGLHFRAVAPAARGTRLPLELIDAEIDVQGACEHSMNPQGAIGGFILRMPSTNHFKVLRAGTTNLFDRPLMTIAEFHSRPPAVFMRSKLAGTVLAHFPGHVLFLQDGSGVARADLVPLLRRTSESSVGLEHDPQTQLEPGERIELIGVRWDDQSPLTFLYDGEFRRIGRGPIPIGKPTTAKELRTATNAHQLVTLKGRIVGSRTVSGPGTLQQAWIVENEGQAVQARLDDFKLPEEKFPPQTWVRVTGVHEMYANEWPMMNKVILRLRSAADLAMAPAPPFWSRPEYQKALPIGIALGAAGLALLLFQRWQMQRLEGRVAEHTADLRNANEQLQREVAQRRAAEVGLRESEERFSKAFHASNARLAILDAETGRYLDVNDAFVQAYGYAREKVLGRTSLDLNLWEDSRQREEAYGILERQGCLRDFESRLRTRAGEVQVVLQSGDFVSVGDRRCILSVGIDITDRKRAEAELLQNYAREKELSELKSRFVSMVSHEFRTPLAIITSSAEILDTYLDRLPPQERKSNLRDITEATRHMSRMMEEVLLLGRVEAGKMTCRRAPLGLAAFGQRLVDEVLSATSNRCPIQLRVVLGMPVAQADEGLLRHIFTNLLNNAVKYSPAGSPVELGVEARGQLAVFTVSDQGIGIPEADARLLFQAFHRGRNVGDTPGTGLGMNIVKRCVELHGGKIAFESREGQGSTFVVTLPLFGEPHSAPGEA